MATWSVPRVSLDTEAVSLRLRVFVDVLIMTRNCVKFPDWNKSTVDKAFRWADHVKSLVSSADDVQKQAVAAGMGVTGIAFVDRSPVQVLTHPVETLLKSIMGSPLLTWITLSTQVVSRTLTNAASRLGHDVTVSLVADVLEAALAERVNVLTKKRLLSEMLGSGGGLPLLPLPLFLRMKKHQPTV